MVQKSDIPAVDMEKISYFSQGFLIGVHPGGYILRDASFSTEDASFSTEDVSFLTTRMRENKQFWNLLGCFELKTDPIDFLGEVSLCFTKRYC